MSDELATLEILQTLHHLDSLMAEWRQEEPQCIAISNALGDYGMA
jgi:hypothetical protein